MESSFFYSLNHPSPTSSSFLPLRLCMFEVFHPVSAVSCEECCVKLKRRGTGVGGIEREDGKSANCCSLTAPEMKLMGNSLGFV